MKRLIASAMAVGVVTAGALSSAPVAAATPHPDGSCRVGGGGFIGGGAFRDCDMWPDGSFHHKVSGFGPFAFGDVFSGRVCDSPPGNPMPPVTDNDPATMCPGW